MLFYFSSFLIQIVCESQQTVEDSSINQDARSPDLPPEKGQEGLYADQEATVRTGHETTDWFQIRKGICQGCILSPCLLQTTSC